MVQQVIVSIAFGVWMLFDTKFVFQPLLWVLVVGNLTLVGAVPVAAIYSDIIMITEGTA